jgi:four helix bundle protein
VADLRFYTSAKKARKELKEGYPAYIEHTAQFTFRVVQALLDAHPVNLAHGDAIFDQLVRCATSISANLQEGYGNQTTRKHLNFMRVAYGSACETEYFLRLLGSVTGFVREDEQVGFAALLQELQSTVLPAIRVSLDALIEQAQDEL